MLVYKLTDENNRTYNNTQWGEGVTHTASGRGEMCGPGWIHFYTDPLLAVLLNPIHADFYNPNCWEAEAVIEINNHGLKFGTTKLTTLRRIELPEISLEQKVKFGILCALAVHREPGFVNWANAWLDGKDRLASAADAAYRAAAYAGTDFNWDNPVDADVAKTEWYAAAAAAAATISMSNRAVNDVATIDLVSIARKAIEGN